MKKSMWGIIGGVVAVILAAGVALGVASGGAGSSESAQRAASLGTESAAIFARLDAAQTSDLPPRVREVLDGMDGIDTSASVPAAAHGSYALHLVRSSTADGVCWVASREGRPMSFACGPRSNIADGGSMSLVVPEWGDNGAGAATGFDFLVVPDGFDQVIGPLGVSAVHDNVAVVPRVDVGGPPEQRSFRRSATGEIVRVAGG